MPYDRLTITIPKETLQKLERIAKKEMRTESNMVAYLIESYREN